MGWMNTENDAEPNTADGMLAQAIRRDVCERLERAMSDDELIADYLSAGGSDLLVTIDVTIDRALEPGSKLLTLGLPDDAPFAGAIGAPAAQAMLASIRQRVRGAGTRPVRALDFEIVVNPDRISLRSA